MQQTESTPSASAERIHQATLLESLKFERASPAPPPSRSKRGAFVIAVGLTLTVTAGVWLVYRNGDQKESSQVQRAAEASTPVVVAPLPAPASISAAPEARSQLDASGYVVARRRATVSSKVTGKVVEVLIEEGSRVSEGQVMARLDDSNSRAAMEQARTQVAKVQADLAATQLALADAEPIFRRSERQYEAQMISPQAFDTARATFNGAKSAAIIAQRSLDAAVASLAVAQRNVDDMIVRAPFSGIVTEKAAQPGEIVSPMSAGGGFTRTGIGTIVDMDSLEIEVDINENFITRVHAGQHVAIRLNAYPDWVIDGEVLTTIPAADRAKATVKVRVALNEKDSRIIPDMGARVSFLGEASASGLAAKEVVRADAAQRT